MNISKIISELKDSYYNISIKNKSITIFGSARTCPDSKYFKIAKKIAKKSVQMGYSVITGGGGGIMLACNKGANIGKKTSYGFGIKLPNEQELNKYAEIKYKFNYFLIRKLFLTHNSRIFIIMPGGFGTLDELFELLTLIQTKKHPLSRVYLFGSNYWGGLVKWIKESMLQHKCISKEEMKLIKVIDDINEIKF